MFEKYGSRRGVPRDIPKSCQNGTWMAYRPETIFSTRAKNISVFAGSEFGWVRLA